MRYKPLSIAVEDGVLGDCLELYIPSGALINSFVLDGPPPGIAPGDRSALHPFDTSSGMERVAFISPLDPGDYKMRLYSADCDDRPPSSCAAYLLATVALLHVYYEAWAVEINGRSSGRFFVADELLSVEIAGDPAHVGDGIRFDSGYRSFTVVKLTLSQSPQILQGTRAPPVDGVYVVHVHSKGRYGGALQHVWSGVTLDVRGGPGGGTTPDGVGRITYFDTDSIGSVRLEATCNQGGILLPVDGILYRTTRHSVRSTRRRHVPTSSLCGQGAR